MKQYQTYAAIIYVTETEREAAMRMFDWKPLMMPGDAQQYYEAYIGRDGKQLRVIGAQQDEMGMTAAAALTAKMIFHFAPEYVVMPGIAAGTNHIRDDGTQQFGDVLLADTVWNFSNGKYVSPNQAEIVFGELGFQPRPTSVEIAGDYLRPVMDFITSERNEFYVHCGPLASGTAVVANKLVMQKQVMQYYENTKGVEMESYGVAYAAAHAVEPKPHVIIAKSVCDFADERKDDMYQKFAAFTSCNFVRELLVSVLDYSVT